MSELFKMGAAELVAGIKSKAFSPTEVLNSVLERMEQCSDLRAFITVTEDEARQTAQAAEKALLAGEPAGPLLGAPYSVKDVTNCKGVPTTYGSVILKPYTPEQDSVAVERTRKAGGVLIGKTNTPELAHKIHTESPAGGLTLNPHNADATCGGSSGGAAVAVAAGMGPISLGTDGGGSVRIPASCCGVVGLKPTIGAIPDPDAQDLFGVTAHVGPLARTVADTRLFFNVLNGPHGYDPYGQATLPEARSCRDLDGVRVAWMPKCGNKEVDNDVFALSLAAIKQMESMGAIVEEIELDFAQLEPHFFAMMESRVFRTLRDYADKGLEGIDPTLVKHYENGQRYSSVDYMDALAARAAAFRQVQAVLERFDVIASPTLSAPPLRHSHDPHTPIVVNGVETGLVRAEWYPYTMGFNLTGHPGISIPCGYSNGLPIGLQLAGRWYDEAYLLDVAELLEQALGVPRWATETGNQYA